MSKLYRFPLRYTKEDESHRRQEKGRTMLEMMAVLVIVGILSLLGITAYRIAMKTYRVNESVNEIRTAATAIKAGNFNLIRSIRCDEDGVCSGNETTGVEEPQPLNPSTYISGVEFEGETEWKTTYGQSVYAQQEKDNNKNQIVMTLDISDTSNQEIISVDECASYVNPNIGYDFIAAGNVKESNPCSNEDVRNNAPGCTLADLCPVEE